MDKYVNYFLIGPIKELEEFDKTYNLLDSFLIILIGLLSGWQVTLASIASNLFL